MLGPASSCQNVTQVSAPSTVVPCAVGSVAPSPASPTGNTLLLDAESERGPRPGLLHTDLLKLNSFESHVLEESEAGAQQHRHDIDVKLVDQISVQKLLDHAGTTNHLDGLRAGGGLRVRDR